MDGPGGSSGYRQSRRSRSQRHREWRRRRAELERRASSPSSGSERDIAGPDVVRESIRLDGGSLSVGIHRRPPRRRKRQPTSWEEDIIDGFAIASFVSLEALQNDFSLKSSDRVAFLIGRGSKRKRSVGENGGGPLFVSGKGDPSFLHCHNFQIRKRSKKPETTGGFLLEAGYISDTESGSGDKASENEMDPVFTVCTRREPGLMSVGSYLNKDDTPTSLSFRPRLSVTSRISGLQRSQEKSLDLPYAEFPCSVSSCSSTSCHPPLTSATCSSTTSLIAPNADGLPQSSSAATSSWPKHKPFLIFPRRQQSHYNMDPANRTYAVARPSTSSSASSMSSMNQPTSNGNMSFSLSVAASLTGPLQSAACCSSGASFSPSPGLPPPPPLLQASSQPSTGTTASTAAAALTGQDRLSEDMHSRFLPSRAEKTEGGDAVVQTHMNGGAGSSASGKASLSSSGRSASASAAQAQPAAPSLAFQFHQHNHQHQHTHTHQHFTPFLPPLATAAPMFDKCSGKMEGLYRQTFFPQYPPGVSRIQTVLPSSGTFSSLQGAFQPKGTSPDVSARLGAVTQHVQPKDSKLPDPFGTSTRVSNKPGKWCAMHVRVAWMIFRHQKTKGDPRKGDLCADMLAQRPGVPTLSGIGGSLASRLQSAHNVARPAGLFTSSGGMHQSSPPFVSPLNPHSFLSPPGHFDPFGHLLPYTSLGSLGSSAFGGLGSTALVPGSVFSPKESPGRTVGGFSNSHNLWHRLHYMPAFPGGPPWVQGSEKREEQRKSKEDKVIQVKYEKDRDCLVYGRRPAQASPAGHSIGHRSSTPASHSSAPERVAELDGPPKDGLTLTHCRDKNAKQPASASARAHVTATSSAISDRPRSSSSSAPPTPVPTTCLAPSPFDHQQAHSRSNPQLEPSCISQKESNFPVRPSASTSASLSQDKVADSSTMPLPSPAPSRLSPCLLPPVKVKEERKDEVEAVPSSVLPSHQTQQTYDRPSSRHHVVTPSSSHLCLRPSPGLPLPPPTPQPPPHLLSLSLPPRTMLTESGNTGGIIVGAAGDRISFPHVLSHGHCQPACPWDPWRDQRREPLAMRSDAHLARLFQQQHAQRFLEADRATGVAAAIVTSPHRLPPTSTSSSSSSSTVQQNFGLPRPPHQEQPAQSVGNGGSLTDERHAHILQEDLERARYYGMHPHLSSPLLSSHSHLDQLYTGFFSHSPPHQPGASGPLPHHSNFFSRLGSIHSHPRHVASSFLSKTTSGLVGSLSVGAPPPLIPSVTPGRASLSPHSSRFAPPSEMVLYNTHKDRESR